MGMLIDGVWDEHATDTRGKGGAFDRTAATFRGRITADGSSEFAAEAGRYHLYLAFGCPWCHRVMIFLKLKRLEQAISVTYTEHALGEGGWRFASPEPLLGARFIYEVYRAAVPQFTGRCTVPVLWDKKSGTIVNNESAEIIRMLNREFAAFTDDRSDYYPAELTAEIDAVNERIYQSVNNGAYRCGFALSQEPYEQAVRALFATLDWVEQRLTAQRYLVADRQTEADWRLFPTLVRFDCAYYPLFKCNLRHLYEYPALWRYTRRLYGVPGIAATVDVQKYKENYYAIRSVNPSGVVPLGPRIDFRE
ncbi:MAG TPA: glutathione S-transferase family protein [Steroidobacteraceae bacterium]|nr:glutathione S-transferase family protein [Steroidobacteraceae bacterium]